MNIDSFLATHADALRLRAKRTEMIATNIANSDTPHAYQHARSRGSRDVP